MSSTAAFWSQETAPESRRAFRLIDQAIQVVDGAALRAAGRLESVDARLHFGKVVLIDGLMGDGARRRGEGQGGSSSGRHDDSFPWYLHGKSP